MIHTNEARITTGVIIPNYNSSEFLPTCLKSLINQTEVFDEIIIVDDGSTDHSIALIEEHMKQHPNIRLVKHEKNRGVMAALNTGVMNAQSDYLLLGAADDWYSNQVVFLAKQAAQKFSNVGVICGDAIVERFDLQHPFRRILPYPSNTFISPSEFKVMTRKNYVGFNSSGGMFMNRKAILDAGMLQPITRWHGDWLLYFVVALRHGIYYFNEVFIHVNVRKLSYSEGRQNKKIQDQVMLDTINLIAKQYPDLCSDFKKAALVPHCAIRYMVLFWLNPVARQFLSLRFIWKMIINNTIIVRLGRLFPYRFISKVRNILRA